MKVSVITNASHYYGMARIDRNVFRKSKVRYRDRILLRTMCPLFSCSSGFRLVFVMLILLTCGKQIKCSAQKDCYNFTVYNWNLNSLTAHNLEKINLLEAYNTINKFDVIYLSESYLDSSITLDNDELNITGYNLYRSNHPNNVKRGGA